jgi:SpoVK/Ycf46/Vps4 family AAA+-type ATPase
VNAHSLFSKWFSESGKLITKLFQRISALADADPNALVFVLIDEVESLAMARSASTSSGDPGDGVRAVNALLTQLDALKRQRNVLVMATSNITQAIDAALVDRADIRRLVPEPGAGARYEILRSCVLELMQRGIIALQPAAGEAAPAGGMDDEGCVD